ncbi:MAG: 3-isopropylmalate dehydrogenase [Planctomycetota bacterium]|nr:3-isopropylmalate dehydrogenase [Planctomycetota bacterium]
MATYTISVIGGDGIGPEVIAEARKALLAVGERCGHAFVFREYLAGGAAIDATGVPLPEDTVRGVKDSQALLFGAIGGPRWENLPHHLKPEAGLLRLRRELDAWANLRPAIVFDELVEASTLKPEVVRGTDILVVRELTGGIYFGTPRGISGEGAERRGFNTEVYSEREVERIVRLACTLARARRRQVCSVDKANVLESSQLWREVATRVAREFPDVRLTHMYVDNAAMQLIRAPRQFDVVVTNNMFGDILSDEASQLPGSIGMLASASIGGPVGFFEPIHGSAPDIAGQGIANPLATIATAALLLRHGLRLEAEAQLVERAIRAVLAEGLRTRDIAQPGCAVVGTREMGDAVVAKIRSLP